MPNTNEELLLKAGFFHSLGKVISEKDKTPGEERYKSAHNVASKEVWLEQVPYAGNFNEALLNSVNSDIILQVGSDSSPVFLYPLGGTNYQTWFMDGGTPSIIDSISGLPYSNGFEPSEQWCKPLISMVDATNESGFPSYGYRFRLYETNGAYLNYPNATYEVDYFAGLIRFDSGKRPIDGVALSNLPTFNKSGLESLLQASDQIGAVNFIKDANNNAPRAVAFQYIGQTLSDLTLGLTAGSGITISNGEIDINVGTQSGLTFSQDGELNINVDNQTIKINQENQIYVSGNSVYEWNFSNVTSGSAQPTGITISNTPLNYSTVKVMVNGQVQILGGTTNFSTSDCYFFDGISVKDIDDISIGDELYWNGNVTNYNLSTDDKILFIYEI